MSPSIPAPPVPASRWWRRMGLYSDGWSRLLDWAVWRCPFFFEPLLLTPYAALFFLGARAQRRAVIANLAVIRPHDSRPGRWMRAGAVFREFATMMVDSARARQGESHLTWRLVEEAPFRTLTDGGGAAIILTAHMGNYDVAGPFFARKLGRTLHGVRVAERRPELQSYWEKQRLAQESDAFRIRYNEPGSFLGVELAQILAAGELVAIQGDRVVSAVSPLEVVWHGHVWPLPAGPFALALATGAPVFPIFVLRDGWRRYRIVVRPPFPQSDAPATRSGRQAAQSRLVSWWAAELAAVVETNWSQWLVFEPAFGPAVAPGDEAGRPVVAAPTPSSRPPPPPAAPTPPADHSTRLAPRSATAIGRCVDRLTRRDIADDPLVLRASDRAQNGAETAVMATLSAAVAGAVAFESARWLGAGPFLALGLALPGAFALLQFIMILSGAVVEFARRASGHRLGACSPPRLIALVTTAFLTLASLALLRTPAAPVGGVWLGLTALNALVFIASSLANRLRR